MAYGNSKAAQILFTQFLKKNILPSDSVTVSAIHPGVVRTELHSKFFQAVRIKSLLGKYISSLFLAYFCS